MIEFGPNVALAATVFVLLLIAVAFVAYKLGYSEGAKAGRAYERRYGERASTSIGERPAGTGADSTKMRQKAISFPRGGTARRSG